MPAFAGSKSRAPLHPSARSLFHISGLFFASVVLVFLLRRTPALPAYPAAVASLMAPPINTTSSDPPRPQLFIFRRTQKTASSSMLNALLPVLEPMGYIPIYERSYELMDTLVRNEFIRPHPRRLFVAMHNHVRRDAHPRRLAVIADTLRDGFAQVTAHCRHKVGVADCGERLLSCMASPGARRLTRWRWTGRESEDADTYIDLPLSSAHPALSTAVLRSVLPDAPPLRVERWNVKGSACNATPALRHAYDAGYGALDAQVAELRKRLLAIAGYPSMLQERDKRFVKDSPIEEMLDEAERLERRRTGESYDTGGVYKGKSERNVQLNELRRIWRRGKDGRLEVVPIVF